MAFWILDEKAGVFVLLQLLKNSRDKSTSLFCTAISEEEEKSCKSDALKQSNLEQKVLNGT
jgi:hypothetical protein